jgi:ketosteroid isomerase-like protein
VTEPIKLSTPAPAERTVADRVALRLRMIPGGDALFGLVFRLKPGSWFRKRMARVLAERTIAALNREDWELFTANFAPDVEYVMARRGGGPAWAGADDVYVGRNGVQQFHLAWAEDWGRMEHRPVALYDLGDRAVLLAEMRGVGRASGVEFSQRYGAVNDLDPRRGLTTRVRFFLDWDEALLEAGVAAQ